ncbi:hypothetical protein LSUE1_G008324 [Lachnellula suecica]|uniref:Reverse transcriptase domain-containing protein n=1 Tax=Lachnellula suecica TaxID=602035 RepID=A0A8T9C574_9HELO|nr:hypothetical protein LSUE1_G008324 [Lachnellula suecica]
MASSDILSQTLASITAIKLEELSNQRSSFENGKAELFKAVDEEPNQSKKVQIILDRVDSLPSMGKLTDNPQISLVNIEQFLQQAERDPSVSVKLQQDWQSKLQNELNIHSLKYEYASLYGRLVNEWLSASKDGASVEGGASGFENVGREEMHSQRAMWEEYVFKAKDTDTSAIKNYLDDLFKSTSIIKTAYQRLTDATKSFEAQMSIGDHFNDKTLGWVIKGLLRSDLVTDEKRKMLNDFLINKTVLSEVADVLNMRMASLDKWQWDPAGTPVEQRRQLNGRYRFYHDEDLLQAILLRYIGVKWSVHFKDTLTEFATCPEVWKRSAPEIPERENRRRIYCLGTQHRDCNVESQRNDHFHRDIFLEQLTQEADEQRAGYDSDGGVPTDTRKSGQRITQTLLHTLVAEMILGTRLGREPVVVRSDFKWFGPSLPHSTMFTVLESLGVSGKWIDFFSRALSAPMKFVQDGPEALVQIRKRGTPISGPLSDVLGETVLFCLDFTFNQKTEGARLYRLHDDIWFWGEEETCVTGWNVMTEFSELMGLDFNESKTGSVKVTRKQGIPGQLSSSLPKGDVRWGFLKLDSETGRFLIDQESVDEHVEELHRQLDGCKSIFDWIQAWNVYGARFFSNNFGKPAECYSRAHVDMLLDTFARIQEKLFSRTGGSVTSTIKQMITERFGVHDIPEGYLYFPSSMGGLDLKSPFVDLYLVRNKVGVDPDKWMDDFFEREIAAYQRSKALFEKGEVPGRASLKYSIEAEFRGQEFLSFEDYTKYREVGDPWLGSAYRGLLKEPVDQRVTFTADVQSLYSRLPGTATAKLKEYYWWIIQLYAPEMIPRFGGLNIVEKGLLPTGMVSMFRESRFKWQG